MLELTISLTSRKFEMEDKLIKYKKHDKEMLEFFISPKKNCKKKTW